MATAFAAVTLSACSPSMFFGRGEDKHVSSATDVRPINKACAGIDLPSTTRIDAATFKNVLGCLNSYGALEPVVALTNRLPDAELQPLLDVGNSKVLSRRGRLYELERAWAALASRGELDAAVASTGRLLGNPDLVAGLLQLIDATWSTRGGGDVIIKAAARLSSRLTPANVSELIDAQLTLGRSRAFAMLQKKLRGRAAPCGPGSSASCGLIALADGVIRYRGERADPGHADLFRGMAEKLVNGEAHAVFDRVIGGTDERALRVGLPALDSVFKTAFAGRGRMFDGIASLYHSMNRPITCLDGAARVVNGNLDVIRQMSDLKPDEMATFIKRDQVLKVIASTPVCNYPEESSGYYQSMLELADTPAIVPAIRLLQEAWALQRIDLEGDVTHPMAEFMSAVLSDTGSGRANGPAADHGGIKLLTPVFSELADRGAWDDLMLVMMLPRLTDRAGLGSLLSYLTEGAPELGGASLLDVLQDVVLPNAGGEGLARFLSALGPWIDSDDAVLAPAMQGARAAFFANSSHPLIDLAREVLADGQAERPAIQALLSMASRPEFKPAVKLLADMAADGRLRELTDVTLALLAKPVSEGAHDVPAAVAPAFVARARHDLSSENNEFNQIGGSAPWPDPGGACARVKLGWHFDRYADPEFGPNLLNVADCINYKGEHQDLARSMRFLLDEKLESGQPFLSLPISMVKALDIGAPALKTFVRDLLATADDGRFYRTLDVVPYLTRPIGGMSQSAIDAVVRLARPLMANRASVDYLGAFAGRVLARDGVPKTIRFLEKLDSQRPPEPRYPADLSRQKRLVAYRGACGVYEGVIDAGGDCRGEDIPRDLRDQAARALDEYENAAATGEWVDGALRRSWTLDELKARLAPILAKHADPQTGYPGHARCRTQPTSAECLADPPATFSAAGIRLLGHYAPGSSSGYGTSAFLTQALTGWSNDFTVLAYRDHPGDERGPRPRLASTLDRLELMILDADFDAPYPISKNAGLEALARIGDAWGDEDPSRWPAPIAAAARRSGRDPETLDQAAAGIVSELAKQKKLVKAVTLLPGHSRKFDIILDRVLNLEQTFVVLDELRPGARHPHAGQMKVLRDLFFELYYSSPADCRTPKIQRPSDKGEWDRVRLRCNNLSLVGVAAKMGLAHQIGRGLRRFDAQDPALADMIAGLAKGAAAPDLGGAVTALFEKDPGSTIVMTLVQNVFSLLDQPEESQSLRDAAFYALAESSRTDIAAPGVKSVLAAIREHGAGLAQHPELVDLMFQLVAKKQTGPAVAKMYGSNDAEARRAFWSFGRDLVGDERAARHATGILLAVAADPTAFQAAVDLLVLAEDLTSEPGFPKAEVSKIVRQMLDFLEENGTPEEAGLARKLRLYAADRLTSGELDQALLIAARKPDEVSRVLRTLAHYIEAGELQAFLKKTRESISQISR